MAGAPNYLQLGMAQYDRCAAQCERASTASCAGFDLAACHNACIGFENYSVNGVCTDVIGTFIDCYEAMTDPCSYAARPTAVSCVDATNAAACCQLAHCTADGTRCTIE